MDREAQPPPRSKTAALLRRLLPPLAAFALARSCLIVVAARENQNALAANAWSRWDSAHYLSIVERGYEFFSCARIPGYDPTHFCGNTGWLPGLPMLIEIGVALQLDPLQSGVFLTGLFALATLFVLWNGFLGPQLSASGLLTLALAAFFPGFVYDHALFPVSLCALCHVSALYYYNARRYAAAGLAGGAGAFSYSSGVFLAGVLGVHLLITGQRRPIPKQLLDLLKVCGLIALGFAAFLLVLQLEVGEWRAYFLVQKKYNFGLNAPWHTLAPHFDQALTKIPSLQTCFVALLALVLLTAALRAPRSSLDGALVCFTLVYWLVPLILGGGLSLYRAEAVLMPAVLLARKLPLPALAALLVLEIHLGIEMGRLFFTSVLV